MKDVIESFVPFHYLWDVAELWKTSYASWMNNPFDTLNYEEIDENVNSWFKGLFKTLREFQKREIVSQAQSTELIRNQVQQYIGYICI